MHGTNPFSTQWIANDTNSTSHTPSTLGALPYPGTSFIEPPLQTRATFRFTSLSGPNVLHCSVIGPGGETCYRFETDPGQVYTLLKSAAGPTIAIVDWRGHPTVEARGVCVKQYVGEWLRLLPGIRSRAMIHNGVHYLWTPAEPFVHLFAPGSPEWLARVTRSHDAVTLELTPRAIELGLTNAAILGTALFQCGRQID